SAAGTETKTSNACPSIIPPPYSRGRALFRLDACGAHHLRPFPDFTADIVVVLSRRATDRLEIGRRQPFLDLRHCQRLYRLGVQKGDHMPGRTARSVEAVPQRRFISRQTRLADGWKIRN